MNLKVNKCLDFFGRLCLATTFAIAIPPKILKFSSVVKVIANKGISESIAAFLLIGAIVCLIGGVGFLIFGKDQRIGSLLLLVFLIPTTAVMHLYPFQSVAVFMNLGLIGGLIISLTRFKPPQNREKRLLFDELFDNIFSLLKKYNLL
tara:strand:- start:2038 stop:2481 length:444 start_codon:yes stop_codon:yes gene_type:complete